MKIEQSQCGDGYAINIYMADLLPKYVSLHVWSSTGIAVGPGTITTNHLLAELKRGWGVGQAKQLTGCVWARRLK